MTKNAIYYDASKCTACKACQISCKQWNQLPSPLEQPGWTGSYESPARNSGDTWLRTTFNEVTTADGKVGWAFGRDACQHCTEAACVKVCPTSAMHYTDDGTVGLSAEKCIGCKYCIAACPFDIPQFSEREGISRKCWQCQNRTQNGLSPACVAICPTGALQYGERSAMISLAKDRVEDIKSARPEAMVYGDTQMDGLHVIQMLPYGAEAHGMPVAPAERVVNAIETLLRPLTVVGVLGLAGVALASFIGGRGFNQEEALKHAYPDDGSATPEVLVVEEVVADEGGDA